MSESVKAFRELHNAAEPLCLLNAWDAGSARLLESLGARAVATTSAGVAWALGYADGRMLPVDEALGVVARMTRVLKIPLSVDFENGYSDDAAKVAQNAQRLFDLGVAGINIEDGPDAPDVLAAKIEAIRNAAVHAGVDIFINARCDVVLGSLVDAPRQIEESIARGNRYAKAGADGFFVPALRDGADIEALAAGVALPLNVMVWAGLAPAAELGKLGVRRLSTGSGIAQVALRHAAAAARMFLDAGRSEPITADGLPRAQLQGLFAA
jgi:2-methylisocitrate lyase-like PEP mutase family enzyme